MTKRGQNLGARSDGGSSARPYSAEIPLPRKPERANGVARYKLLVAAVETLVAKAGTPAVTIQAIAKQARVPMPSVYHFFPSPVAACLAAAERHQKALASIVAEAATDADETDPDLFFRSIEQPVIAYYNAHPAARRLILGSDCSWHIRRLDLERNTDIAGVATTMLAARFGVTPSPELTDTIAICATLVDAVWSLSIAKHDLITAHYAEEAHRAAAAYARTHLPDLV